MGLLWTILIGFLAGILAKFIMPGKDPGGFIITTLLGIGGALLFTYLGKFVGIYEVGESAGFIGAVLGAILLLGIYRFVKTRT